MLSISTGGRRSARCVTSAAVAANTIDSSSVSGSAVSRRGRVEADRDEVGERAGLDAAGVGPAEAARGWSRRASSACAVKWPRRSVFSRRLSSTARASSKRSMIAWLSLPRLRFGPGVADAVGEVALGRRAHADRRLAAAARWSSSRQVRRVDGGRVRPQRAVLGQQLDRRDAVGGEAGLVLGALLGDVEVQRLALAPTRRRCPSGRAGTARTEWIAAPTLAPSIGRDPLRPARTRRRR